MPSAEHLQGDALLKAAQAGDRDACDQLLRHHQPMIWALCRRIVGDDHSAADAAQEAMISIVRNLGRFDGRSSLRTWIYRVATNAALDEIRRRQRRPQAVGDQVPEANHMVTSDQASAVDDRLLIDEALGQLPPDFRAAVVLRDLVDLDYAEISSVLSVPPGTVRSRIARGRRQLAEQFMAADGNHDSGSDRPKDGYLQEPPNP
jgi:RNA polymerase sigma-70 factor, ECF subfamily